MASRGWNTADHSDWGCDICGRDAAKRSITRRGFMKNGALALIGTSAIPAFLSRSVLAEMTTAAANKKKLVVLFQRGAVDGLNVVVPYTEKNYYAMRPSIAIKQNEVIDLDGFFGLHPADGGVQAAIRAGASGDRACGRLARPLALALRRAGLHGERHARRQGDRGWLAEPRARRSSPKPASRPPSAPSRWARRCRARSRARCRRSR